jgi:hypothetical protein
VHHHHHPHHHESRKKKILKRNKRHYLIWLMTQVAREEDEKRDAREHHASMRARIAKQRAQGKKPNVAMKLQMIRNRNDGSRKQARERWNRFAGTGDEGGRGL